MEKKRVVAYVRTCMDEAVDLHCKYLQDILANCEECELVDYYCEQASGKNASRPIFNRMIADAESGKFDYIIVKSIAKLSRDASLIIETIDHKKEKAA